MPILDLQQRVRQLGEIRIGHVVQTGRTRRDGKPLTRPAKLNRFRFTSPSKEILTDVADLYGGEVQPWTPANGGPSEYEVYSTTDRLPVLIPPRDAVSQWYELWSGSKCQRRCDGVTEHKRDRKCLCDPEDRECKITTRVNVMLRDVPALGQWLLVSKGYYAGITLPPAAELLSKTGGYVDGWLGMEERMVMREEGPARFMVPTLDVTVTPIALMTGQVTLGAGAVPAGPERVAITSGRPDYAALASVATTSAEVGELWRQAVRAGHMDPDLEKLLSARGSALAATEAQDTAGEEPPPPGEEPAPEFEDEAPAEEIAEAEIVEDDDERQGVWFQIIAAAGPLGWTTTEVEQRFVSEHGRAPGAATVAELRAFLTHVRKQGR
ncbi:hypothetical protein ACIP5N_34110 [Streptomyces sp. NPDC088768]|uniref:recombination directionality factor n=1 Tax=Streptomyces sp. NPDC088768 TaxID=3365894 RepID=UPI00382B8699